MVFGITAEISVLGRMVLSSGCQLVLSIIVFFLVVARINDIGIPKIWAALILLPLFFGLDNMLLVDHHFYGGDGIGAVGTYLSILATGITLVFIVFLLARATGK